MPHVRPSEAELDRIAAEQKALAQVFLTYVLTLPVTDADCQFIRERLVEALGTGYRITWCREGDSHARFEAFNPTGRRIADRLLIAQGIPAAPGA